MHAAITSSSLRCARRVLVCLRYGIGDVVMQMPALDTLRRAVPEAHITALGAYPAIELLHDHPSVDALACVQHWGLRHWGDRGTPEIKAVIKAWLDRESFDVILDPSHAVIAVHELLKAQQVVTLDTSTQAQNHALQTHANGAAAVQAATLQAWGLTSAGKPHPRVRIGAKDRSFAARYLRARDLNDCTLVAISPVASSKLKCWPIERLAVVADRIAEQQDIKLLAFCGPDESAAVALLSSVRCIDRITIVKDLHLQKIAALLAQCVALVGNDTGLMHIAAAVGVPVVAIFGPTSSTIYRPPAAKSIDTAVTCCYRKTHEFGPPDCVVLNRCLIDARGCIEAVEITDVLNALQALLCSQSTPMQERKHPAGSDEA